MSCSDIINIISIIVSAILSIAAVAVSFISVRIARQTLEQNSRMIENATRPYITIYSDFVSYDQTVIYLILRNFGQSSGCIVAWDCDTDVSFSAALDKNYPVKPFQHIEGTILAPGQAIHVPLNYNNVIRENSSPTFKFTYTFGEKLYTEEISVNLLPHADHQNLGVSQHPSIEDIVKILHEKHIHEL